jgi:hypothetical protein
MESGARSGNAGLSAPIIGKNHLRRKRGRGSILTELRRVPPQPRTRSSLHWRNEGEALCASDLALFLRFVFRVQTVLLDRDSVSSRAAFRNIQWEPAHRRYGSGVLKSMDNLPGERGMAATTLQAKVAEEARHDAARYYDSHDCSVACGEQDWLVQGWTTVRHSYGLNARQSILLWHVYWKAFYEQTHSLNSSHVQAGDAGATVWPALRCRVPEGANGIAPHEGPKVGVKPTCRSWPKRPS